MKSLIFLNIPYVSHLSSLTFEVELRPIQTAVEMIGSLQQSVGRENLNIAPSMASTESNRSQLIPSPLQTN